MKVKAFIMIVSIVFFSQTAYATTFHTNDKATSEVGITFIEETNISDEEGNSLPSAGGFSKDYFVLGTILLIVGMIVIRKSLKKKKGDSS